MSEPLRLTIVYEDGGGGWIIASVPEVPGMHSQGRTREEARAKVTVGARGLERGTGADSRPSRRTASRCTPQPRYGSRGPGTG